MNQIIFIFLWVPREYIDHYLEYWNYLGGDGNRRESYYCSSRLARALGFAVPSCFPYFRSISDPFLLIGPADYRIPSRSRTPASRIYPRTPARLWPAGAPPLPTIMFSRNRGVNFFFRLRPPSVLLFQGSAGPGPRPNLVAADILSGIVN